MKTNHILTLNGESCDETAQLFCLGVGADLGEKRTAFADSALKFCLGSGNLCSPPNNAVAEVSKSLLTSKVQDVVLCHAS